MLQLINPDCYGEFIDDLAEMHRLRYRIFKERLGWDVQVSGDMEVDEFDACRPVYLLQKDDDNRIQGCVRLLPTTGPTMLRDTFPALLDGQAAPARKIIVIGPRSSARRPSAVPWRLGFRSRALDSSQSLISLYGFYHRSL